METIKQDRSYQFGIRTLLVLAALVAVSLVAWIWIDEMLNSKPISVAVEGFNAANQSRYDSVVDDGLPILTPDQVIAFLQSNDEIVTNAPPHYKAIFEKIVRTRRIPNNVRFDFISLVDSLSSNEVDAWLVGMEVNERSGGYRMNIRKIDNATKPINK